MKVKTRRAITAGGMAAAGLILAALAFVFYFMDLVYEAEDVLDPADVPPAVRQGFDERFARAEAVQWTFADQLYEAVFTWQGQEKVEAYFHPHGSPERIEYPMTVDGLPEKARAYLEAQRLRVAAVERVERPGAPTAYEAEIGNLVVEYDCEFDTAGNLLKRTRDESPLEEQ